MSARVTRRELLAATGAAAAGIVVVDRSRASAQTPAGRPVVFAHTTVVGVDRVQEDVALAVSGDTIAAIGPTDQVLQTYRNADVYDGRGKAIVPGLVNCHAHL